MRRFWSVLGLTTALATLQLIGFPNQRANEAQAHCRAWHPHHCTIQEVVDDVGKTVDRWGLAAVSPKLIPVSGYLEFLLQQGNGRWQRLPDDFKTCYREHYRFNLDDVRFATNVNTIHGQGITVDSQIYFPRDINLSDRTDRRWMLHELEHVRQYQVVGGVSAFLVKYVVQGGIEVGRNGSINIHDNIGLEREADSKADRILDACSNENAVRQKLVSYYRDFLSREPRLDEINFRMNAFRNGYPLERQRTDIAFSEEVRQKIIGFFRQYLGRDPDANGIKFRMNALLNGRTLEQQRVDIQTSPEARNRR
jgi:hypothetical protein